MERSICASAVLALILGANTSANTQSSPENRTSPQKEEQVSTRQTTSSSPDFLQTVSLTISTIHPLLGMLSDNHVRYSPFIEVTGEGRLTDRIGISGLCSGMVAPVFEG